MLEDAIRELAIARLRIAEESNAGLERARRSGKVLERPDRFKGWALVLADMKEQGFSQGGMRRETALSYNTVKRYLKRLETPASAPASSTNEARCESHVGAAPWRIR
jgi:hypothetical protein